jgi:hypothetical protein
MEKYYGLFLEKIYLLDPQPAISLYLGKILVLSSFVEMLKKYTYSIVRCLFKKEKKYYNLLLY